MPRVIRGSIFEVRYCPERVTVVDALGVEFELLDDVNGQPLVCDHVSGTAGLLCM